MTNREYGESLIRFLWENGQLGDASMTLVDINNALNNHERMLNEEWNPCFYMSPVATELFNEAVKREFEKSNVQEDYKKYTEGL